MLSFVATDDTSGQLTTSGFSRTLPKSLTSSIRPDFGDGSVGSLFVKFVGEAHVTRRGFHGEKRALANAKSPARDVIGQSARVPALESH